MKISKFLTVICFFTLMLSDASGREVSEGRYINKAKEYLNLNGYEIIGKPIPISFPEMGSGTMADFQPIGCVSNCDIVSISVIKGNASKRNILEDMYINQLPTTLNDNIKALYTVPTITEKIGVDSLEFNFDEVNIVILWGNLGRKQEEIQKIANFIIR